MARTLKKLYECSFRTLYTFKNMHYQEIVEGTIKFPWALFMLLDHPKFALESEKQRNADLRKIYKQMDQKYLNSIILEIKEDGVEEW